MQDTLKEAFEMGFQSGQHWASVSDWNGNNARSFNPYSTFANGIAMRKAWEMGFHKAFYDAGKVEPKDWTEAAKLYDLPDWLLKRYSRKSLQVEILDVINTEISRNNVKKSNLAKRLGVSRSAVTQILKSNLTIKKLEELLEALELEFTFELRKKE